jgi:RNA polymerase sigma-70 factor (ECF subfamily)
LPSNSFEQKNDNELIALFQQSGDNQWLGLLLERHTMLLLGIAMKYLKDRIQAQDAVQQVFIKAITHFPKEPIQNFKGWLYILMRNYCFGVLRSNNEYYSSEIALANYVAPESKSHEELITDELMFQSLHKAIDCLSDEQKLCIRLFYIEERSYKEIMDHTNFSFEQVKSYVQNGKRNLKITIQKLNSNHK